MWVTFLTRVSNKAAAPLHLEIQSHIYFYLETRMVQAKIDLKKQYFWSHIEIIPVLYYSFNVGFSKISHRHEENTHNIWRAILFLSLLPALSFQNMTENHVSIFINNYQGQTLWKQKGQAGAALQQQRWLCDPQPPHISIQCTPWIKVSEFISGEKSQTGNLAANTIYLLFL